MRPNLVISEIEDDHIPAATAAGSVEPMRRADHKAKRHPRPAGVDRTRRVRCVSKRESVE